MSLNLLWTKRYLLTDLVYIYNQLTIWTGKLSLKIVTDYVTNHRFIMCDSLAEHFTTIIILILGLWFFGLRKENARVWLLVSFQTTLNALYIYMLCDVIRNFSNNWDLLSLFISIDNIRNFWKCLCRRYFWFSQ